MDELNRLEEWAAPLLARLQPAQRNALARRLATEMRRSQQQRISQQRNPDGTAYAPRKPRAREKAGRVRRAMFQRLRQAKHLKAGGNASEVWVGFVGRTARIARVHQEGLVDRVSPDGPRVRYEPRALLGFTAEDVELVQSFLLANLAEP
ncbi:MAG TPA: phage virion morphogenesis protein [Lysobacter sp.]|nr:phage virion morphogenesis protein [Lysobacter sp.]